MVGIRIGTLPVALMIGLAVTFTVVQGQEETTLTFQDVLTRVREGNPRLQAASQRVEATRALEPGAGLLPDPTLQIGFMNLALPEFSADMPASMAPSIQAMQRFPIAGKLSLREEVARQSTEMSRAAEVEVWWTVRTEAATAFYRLYRADRQIEVMERTLGLLKNFETVTKSLYSAGSGRQADVLRASVEVARMEAEIHGTVAVRKAAAAHLNAVMNLPADTPVPTPDLGPLPTDIPDHATLRGWAMDDRPLLEELRLAVDRADTRRELAKREIWPDLTLGLQYGLGRMQGDPQSMGGASLSFSIPVFAGKRQMKLRDEAEALAWVARARLEDAGASVDAAVGLTLAELERSRTLLDLYRREILPQARATVESSLSAYRAGSVDFMTLVDAQMALNRFDIEYFGLQASFGTALAQLEMTIGRDLSVAGDAILEDR